LAQSLNPLLNSKKRTTAMSKKTMIRMFAPKKLISVSYDDCLQKEDNRNDFFDTFRRRLYGLFIQAA
jgi:hypothetical protein